VGFYLNPKFIGSLGFTGHFQGKDDIQPQAYYSESHLDTLGVCIFLALAKKYVDENTIVILDDVITSIDQTHMTRFINMLHDETGNFNQLMLHTTTVKDRHSLMGLQQMFSLSAHLVSSERYTAYKSEAERRRT
jgi:recombinational DNA repair ATPase RecF